MGKSRDLVLNSSRECGTPWIYPLNPIFIRFFLIFARFSSQINGSGLIPNPEPQSQSHPIKFPLQTHPNPKIYPNSSFSPRIRWRILIGMSGGMIPAIRKSGNFWDGPNASCSYKNLEKAKISEPLPIRLPKIWKILFFRELFPKKRWLEAGKPGKGFFWDEF